MSMAELTNVKVVSTPVVVPTRVIDGSTISNHLIFEVTDGTYTYPVTAWEHFADELQKNELNVDSKVSLICGISCWKQGIKHPVTQELILDKEGKGLQVQKFMLFVSEIKDEE